MNPTQPNILTKLAHSRRIWVFAISTIVTWLFVQDPRLGAYKDQLNAFIGLAISVILGLSLEDAAKAWGAHPEKFNESLRDLVIAILEEMFGDPAATPPTADQPNTPQSPPAPVDGQG